MSSRHLVDPTTLSALDAVPAQRIDDDLLPGLRAWSALEPVIRSGVTVAERFVPGAGGAPDLRVLVLTPAGLVPEAPAFFHIHGGGLVSGRPDLYLTRLSEVADDCRCVIVATSYRLAPETRWPGALEDLLSTLTWTHEHAAELGFEPTRIAVGEDSVGGGHAATLALHIRDAGGPPILFQLLVYPMLNDRLLPEDHPAGEFIWTREHNRMVGHPCWASRRAARLFLPVLCRRVLRTYRACRRPISLSARLTSSLAREVDRLKGPDAVHIASAMIWNILLFHTYDRDDLLRLNGQLLCSDGTPLEIVEARDPFEGALFSERA